MKRHDKNRPKTLTSKVWKFSPHEDEHGKYIPYCTYTYHFGIILDEEVCNERRCLNYHKLYLKNKKPVWKKPFPL